MIHAVCVDTKWCHKSARKYLDANQRHCHRKRITTTVRMRYSCNSMSWLASAKNVNGRKPLAGSSMKKMLKKAPTDGVGLTLHRCHFTRCSIWDVVWKRVSVCWIWKRRICPELRTELLARWISASHAQNWTYTIGNNPFFLAFRWWWKNSYKKWISQPWCVLFCYAIDTLMKTLTAVFHLGRDENSAATPACRWDFSFDFVFARAPFCHISHRGISWGWWGIQQNHNYN